MLVSSMTVGELRKMLEPFSDNKKVVFERVSIDTDEEDYETTTWESDMQVHSMYGKDRCIIELEDV